MENSKSIIWKIDHRLKLMILILYIILVWLSDSVTASFILSIPIILGIVLSGIELTTLLRYFLSITFFASLVLTINLFFNSPSNGEEWTVLKEGRIVIYLESVVSSIIIYIKLLTLTFSTILFVKRTSDHQISSSVKFWIYPLKYLKVNIDSIALTIMLSIKFVPFILSEISSVRISLHSKGVNIHTLNPVKKLKNFSVSVTPIFSLSFQHVENLSNALEARGFSGYGQMTNYHSYKLKYMDFFTILIVAASISVYLIMFYQLEGKIIPEFIDNLFYL